MAEPNEAATLKRAKARAEQNGFTWEFDFTTRVVGGERVVDLTQASDDQLRALQEITVEDFVDGRGEAARQVRRTKFRLADKGMAIERLNKMFGWIIDRNETGRPGDFAKLSDSEPRAGDLRASGAARLQRGHGAPALGGRPGPARAAPVKRCMQRYR
jgi:phage terminase small subunit